jgi:adenosylhomocysteine nucleosidase
MILNRYRLFLILAWLSCCPLVAQISARLQETLPTASNTKTHPITAILGAFADEATILHAQISHQKEYVIQGVRFMTGILNGRPVVVAQTGVGKVNAAITTTLLLEHFQPRELIFTGIAGGVNPGLLPGDLVIGARVGYHDYGTLTPEGLKRRGTRNPFTLQLNPEYFSADSALVVLAQQAGNNLSLEKINTQEGPRAPSILTGVIVTGDVFVSSSEAVKALRQTTNADATEMEGAAVAQVCWQRGVPFLIIRSMSDKADNTAYADAETFYQVAARNSASLVTKLVGKLKK